MNISNKTVVVTGCFQLLHRGHLNILNKAASYGNVIVLLNDDESIQIMKGYLAETFNVRKKNLLDTKLVQRVIRIGTDPTSILFILEPDILIVGDDHTMEEIISKGGKYAKKIITIPYTKGICSRDLYKERTNYENPV